MKKLLVSSVFLSTALCTGAAFAEGGTSGASEPRRDPRAAWFDKLDQNADGKIDKSETVAAADQRFARLDQNADGLITQAEARESAHERSAARRASPVERTGRFDDRDENKNGKLEPSEAHLSRALFDKLDDDKDGGISRQELEAARRAQAEARKEKSVGHAQPGWFERLDENADGSISQGENQSAAVNMFDAMDADHNGFLTRSEVARRPKAQRGNGSSSIQKGTSSAGRQ